MNRLIWAGLLLVVAGFGVLFFVALGQGASAGGVIFIGPFPIVFGSGPGGWELAVASAVIGAVTIAMFVLWGWGFHSGRRDETEGNW